MKLFDDIERNYDDLSFHNEDSYNYYNRSSRNDITIIRNKLNEWFADYPEAEKSNFKNGFKKHFEDYFFELFLFHLFKKMGFEIKIHPKIANSQKCPDFLVYKDDISFYIEAKVATGKSKTEEAFERKRNQFYDDFSKIQIKGFYLNIETLEFKSVRQPSAKTFIKVIESEAKKLNPAQINTEIEARGFDCIPKIKIETDDLFMIVEFLPVVTKRQNDIIKHPIGVYPGEDFIGGGEDSLRSAIQEKAKRYGLLDKPFLVCVNSLDIKCSGKIDFENVIWGSLAYSWNPNSSAREGKFVRQPDGIFWNNKRPRLQNLSGVMMTKIVPHNIPHAEYYLFEHPFTNNHLDLNKLNLKYSYIADNNIIPAVGNNLDEILEINKNWISE